MNDRGQTRKPASPYSVVIDRNACPQSPFTIWRLTISNRARHSASPEPFDARASSTCACKRGPIYSVIHLL
jgi:hypothetical protein